MVVLSKCEVAQLLVFDNGAAAIIVSGGGGDEEDKSSEVHYGTDYGACKVTLLLSNRFQ